MTSFHVVVNLPRVLVAVETGVGLMRCKALVGTRSSRKLVHARARTTQYNQDPPPWPNAQQQNRITE